jgi:hypothetical protein
MQVLHFSLTHLAMVDFIVPNLEFAISKTTMDSSAMDAL